MNSDKTLSGVIVALKQMEEGEYNYFHKGNKIAPSRKAVVSIIKNIQSLMFPAYFVLDDHEGNSREEIIEKTFSILIIQYN